MNPLKERLQTGTPTVGTWCEIPNPFVAEILARAGFDFVSVDWQHGLHGFESLISVVHAIASGGAAPVVRVPTNQDWAIQKALDVGAFGVIVPMVGTAEEAYRAARACRFPPDGVRSYGPIRAGRGISADPETINSEVLCIPMVETVAGIENIKEIVATPGVDAIIIGPYDLSLSMNLPLGSTDVAPYIDRALEAGRSAGIPVGRHFDSGRLAEEGFARGFGFVTIGTDRELLASTAVAEALAARSSSSANRFDPAQTAVLPVATAAPE